MQLVEYLVLHALICFWLATPIVGLFDDIKVIGLFGRQCLGSLSEFIAVFGWICDADADSRPSQIGTFLEII